MNWLVIIPIVDDSPLLPHTFPISWRPRVVKMRNDVGWWPGRQILLGQTTGQRLLRSGVLSQESTWEGAGSEGGEPWQQRDIGRYFLTPWYQGVYYGGNCHG